MKYRQASLECSGCGREICATTPTPAAGDNGHWIRCRCGHLNWADSSAYPDQPPRHGGASA